MPKRISLSNIIKPDESEYVNASDLEVGLTDAYQPVMSGSAMHARPLPVNMYTYDEDSEKFDDTPLSRAPMRINRRYVPSNKENLPLKQSIERPEFPLYEEQKIDADSGQIFPKSQDKFTDLKQFEIVNNNTMIHHDFEDEVMSEFVTADPNVIGLLQKLGKSVPSEVTMSAKLLSKKSNSNSNNNNTTGQKVKNSTPIYTPAGQVDVLKKKIQF